MTAMFGFSFGKLVVLVVVIAAVWYGFKYMSRLQYQREERARARDRIDRRQRGDPTAGPAPAPGEGAEDMVQCPTCKAYVAAKGARNCGRPDCPY
ncbi:hypothetical protein [Ferruginivarius sediminum]|jgi:uncharacterized protein|uniref:Uncharacterized protein n=1 Tax=Ferruginivarius sediminum TaxID=2661937 RepID=A0A369T6F4_9PROT|nr:hypothetical protein [Ferruginivarius sediminum]RDD60900.1 hypothetical protein DRB17_15675 [Ferruginivarius sediminum]